LNPENETIAVAKILSKLYFINYLIKMFYLKLAQMLRKIINLNIISKKKCQFKFKAAFGLY
jgi:hypothetical protein